MRWIAEISNFRFHNFRPHSARHQGIRIVYSKLSSFFLKTNQWQKRVLCDAIRIGSDSFGGLKGDWPVQMSEGAFLKPAVLCLFSVQNRQPARCCEKQIGEGEGPRLPVSLPETILSPFLVEAVPWSASSKYVACKRFAL